MDIVSVVGGRTTLLVVREAGMTSRVLHSSSGGASSLEILHGDTLPGVEALSDAVPPADRTTTVSVNELLRRLPLFQGCTSHQMKVTAKKFVRRVHAKGDYIIYRDDRHARMWVVAEGGLVAYNRPEYSSFPARYVGKGQTVGMYEFLTQAPAKETVRAAQVDTVTYQLTSSALNELLNAHPDLAAQLLQNISDPLRLIAAAEYRRQQAVEEITWRAGCRTRTPFLSSFPSRNTLGEDIMQELLSTVCLQKLMMRYTPFVACSIQQDPLEDIALSPGVMGRVTSKLQMYSGLPYVCLLVVLKNVLYHYICSLCQRPLIAAVISAAVSAPLRVLSYGISYNDVSTKMVMDEALISAAISVAPLACYATGLVVQNKLERRSQSRISRAKQVAVMAVVKAVFSFAQFPFIYQRNFLYTQPSVSRFWDQSAFKVYQLKQLCELLLNLGFHNVLSLVAPGSFQG
ncbi:hypothetical protein STCU_06667 [Strigomonas culicis]|nr:hypothetical protein STCU_06667 [Strigomonas culicis]|eukprot:EPY25576.1 hypothetical protein STCU_06667 [Strigomonas culicis]